MALKRTKILRRRQQGKDQGIGYVTPERLTKLTGSQKDKYVPLTEEVSKAVFGENIAQQKRLKEISDELDAIRLEKWNFEIDSAEFQAMEEKEALLEEELARVYRAFRTERGERGRMLGRK